MIKSFSFAVLVLGMMTSVQAADFDLRSNMIKLDMQLNEIQRAMMAADKKVVKAMLPGFRADVHALLSDKEKLLKTLPDKMEHKRHKVNLAISASREIDKNIQIIEDAIGKSSEKDHILARRSHAQEAFTNIVNECFNCHNLARDKEKLKN